MSGLHKFRSGKDLRHDVATALRGTYGETPDPVEVDYVIDRALDVVASDVQERAMDQTACQKVDDCAATSVVLSHLAWYLRVAR